MSTDEICEVIITAPDPQWLAEFTKSLVETRLCACGHNIAQVRSVYRWEDAVHDKQEARVALHTRRTLVSAIVDQVESRHPYQVACVVALPIVDGSSAYARWVLAETDAPVAS